MRGWASPATAHDVAGAAIGAVAGIGTTIRRWLAIDEARRVLWLPVFVGCGIALYFALAREPAAGLGAIGVLACGSLRWLLRHRRGVAVLATIALAMALGFAAAQLRSGRVAAPVLAERWGPAELSGRVVSVELRPEGRRLILDRLAMPGLTEAQVPARVRLKLPPSAQIPIPGDRIAARAQLVPPPEPASPGAYDFARSAWFDGLGGVGSIRGDIRLFAPEERPEWRLRLNAARSWLVARVLALDPGPAGQVTAALLTGEMGHVAPEVMTQMRDSGLAHLLSISGLHISLVAGIVFFAVRRVAALVQPIALRWPIKKLAAGAAFLAISLYALFAAPGVPTTRAWAMGSIVLLAVVIDRAPLSIRLVAWAALGVMLVMPEALLGPSFQMSFAAVLALIAAFEVLGPPLARLRREAGGVIKLAASAGAMLATTLVASLATAPFAIYHFNRLALLGVIANLVAVPLTSIIVMPAAVLVFALLPFGLEGPALQVMNLGNELVMHTAQVAAAWPAASSLWPAMPAWGLALTSLGGLWLCLWTQAWRLLGLLAIVIGLASPWLVAPPDILVAADGRAIALRRDDGGLGVRASAGSDFVRDLWLRRAGLAVGEAWGAVEPSLRPHSACDAQGCWIERPAMLAAIVTAARELPAACAHATVLITALDVWRSCPGPLWLVDRSALRLAGAHAIWLRDDGVPRVVTVRDERGARPWVRPATGGGT
ncbi:MAG: ComEC family competence protein [Alphaproteobacteria bacterium]|nr:ComEC family competence protein [Alphaproteobacteria bacterium]